MTKSDGSLTLIPAVLLHCYCGYGFPLRDVLAVMWSLKVVGSNNYVKS